MKSVSAYSSASLAALLAASSSQGMIIHETSGFAMGDGGSNIVNWDIDDSGTTDIRLQHYVVTGPQTLRSLWARDLTGVGHTTYGASYEAFGNGPQGFVGGGATVSNLASGYLVSNGAAFNTNVPVYFVNNSTVVGGLQDGENLIGFRFLSNGTSGTNYYGWARININIAANTFEVTEWAYDNAGDSIEVGAVPEPAETAMGLGALALGAAGLRRWRKTRKQAS